MVLIGGIKMNIKTVIFDLGGVYFTDGTSRAIDIISERFGKNKEVVADVFKGDIGTRYRKSEISHEEFWNLAKSALGIDAKNEDLAEIWLSGYVPIEGTVEIVKQLEEQGYELLFLSDNVQERIDYLKERYDFLEHFKDGVFSHIVGTRKPDIKMYQYALDKTENNADECVYIDDKDNLLIPAQQLGMNTIHFKSAEALEQGLNRLGVNVSLERYKKER
ncbi:MAG: HAD family phosphatase [Clostridiales bacterium]|nr:HAD family phosphatase [Clostridiales bacterium]